MASCAVAMTSSEGFVNHRLRCAASRAEAERLCLPWEWVDDEVLAVIPAEAEVAERWQRLNEDLVGSLEGLERLRRDE